MATPDMITRFILRLNRFVTKRGGDLDARRDVVKSLDDITGIHNCIDAIYVNTEDNIMVPDVTVIHLYNPHFADYILDPDDTATCPFGATLEIHQRCFDLYSEEELAAVILHDILQNIASGTAKMRFQKAYTDVISKHDTDMVLDLFDKINLSEICYIGFMEICLRPFKVPVENTDVVATDEVLKTYGLADAYDSYLSKTLPMSTDSIEKRIEDEVKADFRDFNTIIDACLDNNIRYYYSHIKEQMPLISLDHVLSNKNGTLSLGFVSSNRRKPADLKGYKPAYKSQVIDESYNDPKNEIEVRFQIDKIINSMRYAETEAERDVILFKIKQLQLKLVKMERKINRPKRLMTEDQERAIQFLEDRIAELEELRSKTVKMEIKRKRWSVYIKDQLPEGYDF